jgi:hypothetical protein
MRPSPHLRVLATDRDDGRQSMSGRTRPAGDQQEAGRQQQGAQPARQLGSASTGHALDEGALVRAEPRRIAGEGIGASVLGIPRGRNDEVDARIR